MPKEKPWRPPMNPSSKALLWLMAMGLGLFVVISLIVPLYSRLETVCFVPRQMSRARSIHDACLSYASEHQGMLPEGLEVLAESGADRRSLEIDLMDGQPPRAWIYHTGLTTDSPPAEWVLISPPLVNHTATRSERRARERAGGLQYPPEKPVRVLIRVDGPPESMREEEFQRLVTDGVVVLPPIAKP